MTKEQTPSPRRRKRKTPAVPERPVHGSGEIVPKTAKVGAMSPTARRRGFFQAGRVQAGIAATRSHRQSAPFAQTLGESTTCTAMFGSGAGTGMGHILKVKHKTHLGRKRVSGGSSGAVRGTMSLLVAAVQHASSSSPITATSASVGGFAFPRQRILAGNSEAA